jgi:hypothetical protein
VKAVHGATRVDSHSDHMRSKGENPCCRECIHTVVGSGREKRHYAQIGMCGITGGVRSIQVIRR